jgi:Tol biopolymer transport system component
MKTTRIPLWAAAFLVVTAIVPTAAKGVLLMNRIGPSKVELFVANANGTDERRLFPTAGLDYNASFSPDGKWIVFTSERDGQGQADIYRIHPDGAGLERLTDSPSVDDQAALSPDGSQLVLVSTREMHTANIWILDLHTRKARNLTGGPDLQTPGKPDGFFRPSWSPDGKWIAFSSDRGTAYTGHERGAGAGHTQELRIYVIQPDGKNLRRLTPPGVTAGSPKWSGDGQRIVYYEMDPAQTGQARMVGGGGAPPAQIVSIDVTSGARMEHTSGPGLKVSPQFLSADRIGYVIKAAPSSGPTTPGLAFTSGEKAAAGAIRNPAWSPDGKQVVYEKRTFVNRPQNTLLYSWNPEYEYRYTDVFPSFSRDGRLVITDLNFPFGNPDASLSVMDADGSRRVRAFYDKSGAALSPAWSPDGQRIVFGFGGFFGARDARPAKLMMVRADGSDAKDLTQGLPNSGFPSWSPDGKRIVYRVWGGADRGLRMLNLEDHSVKTITTEWDNFPFWSPSGDRIVFTRQKTSDRDFDIFTMRPDGTDIKQLTFGQGTDGHATWTADGKSLFFESARTGFKDEAPLYDTSPQPYAQIFIMKADGSQARQLTDSRWEDSMPVFVPAAQTKRTNSTR